MPDKQGTLQVNTQHELTLIRVLDSFNQEVCSAVGSLDTPVDPGIYRVEASLPGTSNDQYVTVEPGAGTKVALGLPSVELFAPNTGKGATQAQRNGAAQSRSQAVPFRSSEGSLILYARTPEGHVRSELPAFLVRASDGTVVADTKSAFLDPSDQSWVALTMDLPAGTYAIEHKMPGFGRRAQAVFVAHGRETQLFMPWDDVPRFDRAIGFMAQHGAGIQDDFVGEYERTQAAFEGLAVGKLVLSTSDEQEFLYAKFQNPMLGLIGAYSLIARGKVDYDQVDAIAYNLLSLLPGSPDAQLIKLFADVRGDIDRGRGTLQRFAEPPMFAEGMNLLMRLAAQVETLVPSDSWLADVALRWTASSAWTRWSLDVEDHTVREDLFELVRRSLLDDVELSSVAFASHYELPSSVVQQAWSNVSQSAGLE